MSEVGDRLQGLRAVVGVRCDKVMSGHRFAIIVTLLFAVVASVGVYRHEMWRDEFEIFMELITA